MDTMSVQDRSKLMSKIKNKNNNLESTIGKGLFSKGFRYRKNYVHIPGKPDLYFKGRKAAVFIHGCFWHGHTGCKLAHLPKTNSDFWKNKIDSNQIRDQKVAMELESMGIRYCLVWECSFKRRAKGIQNQVINEIGEWLDNGNENIEIIESDKAPKSKIL